MVFKLAQPPHRFIFWDLKTSEPNKEEKASNKSIVTGPRWAAFPRFLKNTAFMCDLELSIDVEKHIVRETVRFEVQGKKKDVDLFKKIVGISIEAYNET